MSALGRQIRKALDEENNWTFTAYRATYIPTKISLWIANGAWFLDVIEEHGETVGAIGIIERHLIWPKVVRCRRRFFANKFKKAFEKEKGAE